MANKFIDGSGIQHLLGKIKADYVLKEAGKGLSTNDFTAEEKAKLGLIEGGAQVNVIESVKVNGQALTVSGKEVDVAVPTKVSDLTNDANYLVAADIEGKVDKTTTVNGKALSSNIELGASDVGAVPASAKGVANGVATLGTDGKIPSTQLPSYVDDVVEGYYANGKFFEESSHTTEIVALSDKIYIDLATNKTYRYGGSTYVEITSGDMVALTNAELDEIYANA